MRAPLVLTVIGPDRPGLVESLARVVSEYEGNWLESRMCHLGGQFAGLLSVSVDDARREALTAALKELSSAGLTVVAEDSSSGVEPGCYMVAIMEIVGQDRPGIVSHISEVFARHGVNVEELETECRSAPMSGEMLFHAKARICLPESCEVDALRSDLEQAANDLLADISFDVESG